METQIKAMPLKQKDANNNLTVILKIIVITSFLFICSIDQVGLPIIIEIFIFLYQFVNDIIVPSSIGIFWEGGLLTGLVISSLIILWLCKIYKDKYILLLCFIALLSSTFMFTGIFNPYNYYKRTLPISFILPMSIFIISSTILIVKNFKKKKSK